MKKYFAPSLILLGVSLLLLVFSIPTEAASVAESCKELRVCVEEVSKLTGDQYIYRDKEFKGNIGASSNFELNAGNASFVLSKILYLNGYTRIPLPLKNTYSIVKLRDGKEMNVPIINASKSNVPDFPDHFDIYILNYRAEHKEVMNDVMRSMRLFISRDARISIAHDNSTISVVDTVQNLKKLYSFFVDQDTKPSKRYRKNKRKRKMENSSNKKKS